MAKVMSNSLDDRERFFSYPEAMSNFLETHFLCMTCMKRHAEFIATNEPLTTSNGQGIRCIEPSCKNIILTGTVSFPLTLFIY